MRFPFHVLSRVFVIAAYSATVAAVIISPMLVQGESERDKGNFRLFDGQWVITDGPLKGLEMQLGSGTREGVKFVLYSVGTFTSYRTGQSAQEKRDTYKGKFKAGIGDQFPDDPATQAGLGEAGIFRFQFDPDSLYDLSGEFISDGGSSVPVRARMTHPTFRKTKLVLGIEPIKRKVYEVGDYVTFKFTAILRGLSGVNNLQPLIEIGLDSSVTQAEIVKMNKISACRILLETYSGIFCDFGTLGPKHVVASVIFKVKVPQELAGKKLAVAVGITNKPNDGEINELFLIDAAAVTRTTKVSIKKSSTPALPGACNQLSGRWLFNNSWVYTFNADRSFLFELNGTQSIGNWTCVKNTNLGATNFIVEATSDGGFPQTLFLSTDGTILTTRPFGGAEITATKVD